MSRIRILHVVRNLGTGGTEAGVRKLLAGLDPSLFEQVVCTVVAGPARDPITGTRIVNLGLEVNQSGFLVPSLFRMFLRERPDIVHSRNWAAIEAVPAARLARVQAVVHSEHGLDVGSIHDQPWRRRKFRRMCLGWADCTFAVSDELRDYYARLLCVSPERLQVIRNGVDTDRFRPNLEARGSFRQKIGASASAFVVGTVSRLDPIKDHRTLFRAAELVLAAGVDLHLVVVGDGPERQRLEDDLQRRPALRGRTAFVGEADNVPEWLNSFDVFVLPSLSEGMSNTLLEAMATGVATVASRAGGNPEVIEEHRSGLLFQPGNAPVLGDILVQLARDAERREAMARRARERIQATFSLEGMLRDYTNLYARVTAREGLTTPSLSQGASAGEGI